MDEMGWQWMGYWTDKKNLGDDYVLQPCTGYSITWLWMIITWLSLSSSVLHIHQWSDLLLMSQDLWNPWNPWNPWNWKWVNQSESIASCDWLWSARFVHTMRLLVSVQKMGWNIWIQCSLTQRRINTSLSPEEILWIPIPSHHRWKIQDYTSK